MKINEKLKIIVAEPWNFSTCDGGNFFYCTLLDVNETNKIKLYLAQTNSYFLIENVKVEYIVLMSWSSQFSTYNIYIVNNTYDINNFSNDCDIYSKLNFEIIGTLG